MLGALATAFLASACTVTTPHGAVDLSLVPTTTFNQPQTFQGQQAMFTWVFNLCKPVNRPPGTAACAEAGYVQQFTASGARSCEASLGNPSTPQWRYDASAVAATATFTDSALRRKATVFVACGNATSPPLSPTTSSFPVADPGGFGVFLYTINLQSSVLCASVPPPPPPLPPTPPPTPASNCYVAVPGGRVDLGRIPTSIFNQLQLYQGQVTPYTWVFNLCQKVANHPGSAACPHPGYVQQFQLGGDQNCDASYDSPAVPQWAWDPAANAVRATFDNAPHYRAHVSVSCGNATSAALTPASANFSASNPGGFGLYITEIALYSTVICPGN